jgi:hypothetical protein
VHGPAGAGGTDPVASIPARGRGHLFADIGVNSMLDLVAVLLMMAPLEQRRCRWCVFSLPDDAAALPCRGVGPRVAKGPKSPSRNELEAAAFHRLDLESCEVVFDGRQAPRLTCGTAAPLWSRLMKTLTVLLAFAIASAACLSTTDANARRLRHSYVNVHPSFAGEARFRCECMPRPTTSLALRFAAEHW